MADQDTKCQLRNVLIGVDGSTHSERAFHFYLNEVCKSKDNLIIFHAQEVPSMPVASFPGDYVPYYTYDEFTDIAKKSDDEAKALLRYYGDLLKAKQHDIKFKLVKEGGNAGEVICKNIVEENAMLVVIGSRGQGTVRRTFLGSVSDYVVHHAHIPVCVVPPPPDC